MKKIKIRKKEMKKIEIKMNKMKTEINKNEMKINIWHPLKFSSRTSDGSC